MKRKSFRSHIFRYVLKYPTRFFEPGQAVSGASAIDPPIEVGLFIITMEGDAFWHQNIVFQELYQHFRGSVRALCTGSAKGSPRKKDGNTQECGFANPTSIFIANITGRLVIFVGEAGTYSGGVRAFRTVCKLACISEAAPMSA